MLPASLYSRSYCSVQHDYICISWAFGDPHPLFQLHVLIRCQTICSKLHILRCLTIMMNMQEILSVWRIGSDYTFAHGHPPLRFYQ